MGNYEGKKFWDRDSERERERGGKGGGVMKGMGFDWWVKGRGFGF